MALIEPRFHANYTPLPADVADTAAVLAERRSVPPANLTGPGPDAATLQRLLTIAARVPDHGALVPWRFITIEGKARLRLADALGRACRATSADTALAERTTDKLRVLFGGPPLVVIVVSRPDAASHIPVVEQILCAGAVCMNLLNAAHALGWGANWLTGWTAATPAAHATLGLADGETIAGIVPVGTATTTPADRPRPVLADIVTRWTAAPAA